MKKKGFTLIELLAVIVILAVIAIISVPIITDLINKSRYGAFGVTKKNIERAAELYHAKNADDLVWDGDISYVTIGTLKNKKFLSNNVVSTLDSTSINDDTKVLLYRKGRKIDYSLQLYDEQFFDWYQGQMVQASKKEDITLPTNIGDKVTIDLETLMSKGLIDELRLPLELDSRCVGYVEIEKTNDNYEYNAYVDCLQGASTFASHYVSYGGKYIDDFFNVKETSDGGYIAVGSSNSEVITKYGTGNNGEYDAIIVKFKADGTVEWSRNFGGSNNDYFYGIEEIPDGYIAVGYTSSNDKDILDYKGGPNDGIIVKYNKQGEVTYKKSYGGSGTNGSEIFQNVLYDGEHYLITGVVNLRVLDGDHTGDTYENGALQLIILKLDTDFNIVVKKLYSGLGYCSLTNFKEIENGYVMIANVSGSSTEGSIYTLDKDLNIVKDSQFSGGDFSKVTFNDFEIYPDGYIVGGYSKSSEGDMEGLSKANNKLEDAIIIKYDLDLNLVWKKSFGGTSDDSFNSLEIINDNKVVAVGYSRSTDMDMQGLVTETNGYSNAIMVVYNTADGSISDKKVFGGSNLDAFNAIIKTNDNKYVMAGNTYSNDINLKNFNKGHSDAILVSYNNNLELEKTFQEPVVIIDKLKTIVPNYGTTLSFRYDKIYTTNDPTKDLVGWCTNGNISGNNNYDYGHCLRPFNKNDRKLLTNIEATSTNNKRVYAGENEYTIDISPTDFRNWHVIDFYLINTGAVEISNLKLKFNDGAVFSVENAISNNYIEPLVIASNYILSAPFSNNTFPNSINLLKTNGNPGNATYPAMLVVLKPKKRLTSIIFTSSVDIHASVGFSVLELLNFDMSITPTE
ncbi:MAG: prepilin-type N-terminal cleavage/methylation domain-containing protein [Bacilli bacterium]|nr:prepilin-type N-terminal cleavage/methylation domain-containing protein [Bacilli bacterium]MDD4608053.1 prepilin-type N-terminal cleavage/methylation domain-containing protein [Bacilli bacterium]